MNVGRWLFKHVHIATVCYTEKATEAWHRQEHRQERQQQYHKHNHQQPNHAATKQPLSKTKTYTPVTTTAGIPFLQTRNAQAATHTHPRLGAQCVLTRSSMLRLLHFTLS